MLDAIFDVLAEKAIPTLIALLVLLLLGVGAVGLALEWRVFWFVVTPH
jgi:hypothetical protein